MRTMTEEGRSQAEWTEMRGRHHLGDDQIRALWRHAREFADDRDDMNFTAATLSAITARTLIVHGDRDPLYPVEQAVELFRGIPNASLWVVPERRSRPDLRRAGRAVRQNGHGLSRCTPGTSGTLGTLHSACRFSISSGETSSLCVAIAQVWPNGSVMLPIRSPQNMSVGG